MRPYSSSEDPAEQAVIGEALRPAAIVPEEAARSIMVELSAHNVSSGGLWATQPSKWDRYDRPWDSEQHRGVASLIGSIQIAYGTPTKYDITIYRVTITLHGLQLGWTVPSLCDEALSFGDLTLAQCPRVEMQTPPKPFHF
jgi:hypothetical protein